MNLADLTRTSGEWLRGTGPESDIVISSRIRLARNLADFPFSTRASVQEKGEIAATLRSGIKETSRTRKLSYLNVDDLSPLDRQLLMERQLISREHATGDGSRGVAFPPEENISLMINEEDHLRMQIMRSGLALMEAWEEASTIDDSLEEGKIKERDFSAALAAIVSGQPVKVAETKAFGCGVKYAKK